MKALTAPFASFMEKYAAPSIAGAEAVAGALHGAPIGALVGGLSGLKKDEYGERHIGRNALIGAAAGTVGGAAMGAGAGKAIRSFHGHMEGKTTGFDGFEHAMRSKVPFGGHGMSPQHMSQYWTPEMEARFAQASKEAAVSPLAVEAVSGAIHGAPIGAVVGGLTGIKKDEEGNRHILRNAVVGAGAGTLAGAGLAGVAGKAIRAHYGGKAGEDIVNAVRSHMPFGGHGVPAEAAQHFWTPEMEAQYFAQASKEAAFDPAKLRQFVQKAVEAGKPVAQAVKTYAAKAPQNAERVIGAGAGAALGGVGGAALAMRSGKKVGDVVGAAYSGAYLGGFGGAKAGEAIGSKLRSAVARKAAPALERHGRSMGEAMHAELQGNTQAAEAFRNQALAQGFHAEAIKRQAQRPFGVPDRMPQVHLKTKANQAKDYVKSIFYK